MVFRGEVNVRIVRTAGRVTPDTCRKYQKLHALFLNYCFLNYWHRAAGMASEKRVGPALVRMHLLLPAVAIDTVDAGTALFPGGPVHDATLPLPAIP